MVMRKKLIAILLLAVILGLYTPQARAISLADLPKIIELVRKLKTYYDAYKNSSSINLPGYVPHKFPFGGRITSTEQACSLKFWQWYLVCYPVIGCYMTPFPGYIPLGGSAITTGEPLPVKPPPGRVITFPFISQIYNNHTEDRVGPWDLGIGFTPFPLDQINSILEAITIPPTVTCSPTTYTGACFDHFHIDCSASGEKDRNGNDIYKVILKLGTSLR